MDFDSFLVSPRWEILQILSKAPSSPMEVANQLNTTVSYVSQQLKLLDAAGLIVKQKTGAFEKGKPRTIFDISKELVHFAVLKKGISSKRTIFLSDYHKRILSIWMLEDESLHSPIEKICLKLEENISEVDGIFLESDGFFSKLLIVSDSKSLKSRIESFVKKLDKKVDFSFISFSQLEKIPSEKIIPLYDLHGKHVANNLKGGNDK